MCFYIYTLQIFKTRNIYNYIIIYNLLISDIKQSKFIWASKSTKLFLEAYAERKQKFQIQNIKGN